jgi:choice-of-anchor B domain-containing protein
MKKLLLLIFSFISLNTFAQPQEANLLGTWNDPTLPPSSFHNNTYNEIWGLAVNDAEIAVIGSTMGTHFIDVTDPSNPTEITDAFVPGAVQGTNIVHRDYHDFGGYLYTVCDESSNSTLQIIDISDLPNSVNVVYDSNDILNRAHNIFIDSASARIYASGVRRNGISGFTNIQVIDISDPTAPVVLNNYNDIPYSHDVYVEDDIVYSNCGNDGFFVVDFTDATNPIILGSMSTYTQQGYNHSGWLANDKQHYYLADETFNRDMKVVDVSDFDDISVLSTFNAEQTLATIPHNLIVRCDVLYVSYYFEGIQIYDISDPANPVRTHFYDTSTETNTNGLYRGNWGVYPFLPSGNILASDMQNGLFVLEAISEHNCEGSVSTKTPTDIYNNIITYPQPATDFIQIELQTTDNQADTNSELIDLTGRTVQVFAPQNLLEGKNEITFDLNSSISNGIYFLRISSEKGSQSHKIIVKK